VSQHDGPDSDISLTDGQDRSVSLPAAAERLRTTLLREALAQHAELFASYLIEHADDFVAAFVAAHSESGERPAGSPFLYTLI
jgi:hypothetical protein